MATAPRNANALDDVNGPEDLDNFVKELMDNMQTRFNRLSENILDRVDNMGSKIDQLEKSINELIDEAGIETSNGAAKKGDAGQKIGEESGNAEF
ncbi:hypothetical protein QTG54_007999 [Skeletonema marinoi]|uniref:Heat shock factor binding protein 1 n=1 Tax=Skeletonema marinoi TaxID=267567 RepID=A0AAD9DBL2_9STRA|nr:hypothetical protein QTG54_007999 [Skeletonema marinoi]|mmetsp:Transcript_33092/g.42786  ORF Transcript_33092/g.42786 Transcript_33092/m.42786 type:complete len:95 (-) Transcript_33092:250-534(-)